ncbi:hypothetical protein DC74_8007 [Streptomyces noursei]|nr:hypothetical protein DC74_8007 [Streptomyces noursei]
MAGRDVARPEPGSAAALDADGRRGGRCAGAAFLAGRPCAFFRAQVGSQRFLTGAILWKLMAFPFCFPVAVSRFAFDVENVTGFRDRKSNSPLRVP